MNVINKLFSVLSNLTFLYDEDDDDYDDDDDDDDDDKNNNSNNGIDNEKIIILGRTPEVSRKI
jgi:hypothetical protein